ncbi:MAG: hypothetical protein A2383_01795 [Candidatus Pacebacteria bacterium RIFOXYB1_FULL_39_46]|nr:MAG: hypothetical protein A2182_03310 [Candidatus Pacebacteria bacterium RIFOXYA1_FULL_38_18]OGJ37902.1 MAG: hypothetical protein A2383_01795 [Candidatus Pacebacteria bacterium RIFOXYB1_FULL_39_46]OGJ39501.1 MAG: hypothetical protein A2411_01950 [Candidatus Pacebacteria bacterium RIFOXYC1_FULL_39_21]OGJ40081.1 MAG: hypothetical protein A2582_03240 [Candidatus Pacebacteria bacterium RIFOXYD1_FULL_39_27]
MKKIKTWLPLYFLILIFLASSWSLFSPKFFRIHDYTHAGRIAEMTRALGDGHFPVRWTQNFGFGYGMPLFEFYGPLPFYLGAIIYWLSADVVLAIKALFLVVNAGTIMGGYLLGKKLFGKSGGLLTAAALTLAPYRAVNLFVRGALNEAWAILFLPWIFLGVIKVFHREKNGWLMLSLALVGLFLSHNIITLLFMPILGLFVFGFFVILFWRKAPEFFYRNQFRWRNFVRILGSLALSVLLALGLSAFYLIPAFFEKNLTQIEDTIFTYYFDYRLHFLYIRQFFQPNWDYGGSAWGVDDDISFFLGWGQWLSLGVLGLISVGRFWNWLRGRQPLFPSKKVLGLVLLFGFLLLIGFYMSLLKSQWLWDQIFLLKYAQFPWRWLSIIILLIALLIGSLTWFIKNKLTRVYGSLLLVIIMVIGSVTYFRPEKFLERNEDYYYTDPLLMRKNLSNILPDYAVVGMPIPPTLIPEELIINSQELPADSFEILVERVHEKLIKTNFTSEATLELAVADYPGWGLEIDNQRWNRQIGENGNISVTVPAGQHLVALRFLSTPVRKYADLLSLFSWLILVFLLIPKKQLNSLNLKKKNKS